MPQYAAFGSTQLDPRLTGEGSPQGVPVSGNEFSKGLRRGGYGALSSLNTLAGAAGQALGADSFAAGRLQAADEAAAEAAAPALAPRVPTLRDIGATGSYVGDAASWLAGKAGEIAPVTAATIGATALTGGGAVPAALAATGTMAPVEIGSVLARQRAQGAPMSLRTAVPAGLGSAALWGVVPGLARAAKVPGGALMAVPEQALLSGGSEGLQQAGAGEQFDPHKIGEAMAEGAVMGVPFAAQHALTSNAGAIKSGIGKAGEAGEALGSAAEAAKAKLGAAKDATVEAAGAAKDATVEAAGKVGAAAKGAAADAAEKFEGYEIPTRLSDAFDSAKAKAQAWMKNVAEKRETMADPQDIVGDGSNPNLGPALAKDDASRVAQATQWVKDMIDEHVPEDVRTKVDAAFSDLSSAVGMKVNAAKRSLKEAADAHLMPEQAQAVKDFLDSPGDQSKQAAVAGMKMSRDALKATAEHVANFADKATRGWREFSDKVKARADEQRRARSGQSGDVVDGEFREVPEPTPQLEGPKKTEDDSGVIAAIAQQVRPVIEEVRPDLYGPGADPEVQRTFARGLRHLVDTIARGGHADSDALIDLMSVTGNKTADVIEAAYKAVGSTDKAKTAGVFRELNSVADLQASHETLVDTLRKNVVPEYKRLLSPATAHEMASGLMQWAQRTRGAAGDAEFSFKDRQIRNEVKRYFGENTPTVYAAVEKAVEPLHEEYAAQRPDRPEEHHDHGWENEGAEGDEQSMNIATLAGTRVQVHAARGDLMYLHPKHHPDNGHPAPVLSRMERMKTANSTGPEPRMLSASELGYSHPLVQNTRRHLIEEQRKLGSGRSQEAMERAADRELEHYVALTTELPESKLQITDDDLRAMTLDRHKFDPSTHPSAIKTGPEEDASVLDAVKVTKAMAARFKDEPWSSADVSPRVRAARMFVEGIAAVQDKLGHTFDIPEGTFIGKVEGQKLTWGDVLKITRRTEGDAKYDSDTQYLVALRKEIARLKEVAPGVRTQTHDDFERIVRGRKERLAVEQTYEAKNYANDEGIEPNLGQGVGYELRSAREDLANLEDQIKKSRSAKRRNMLREQADVLEKHIKQLEREDAETIGRGEGIDIKTENDPFGSIYDATGNRVTPSFRGAEWGVADPTRYDPSIYTDSGEARQPGAGAPSLLGPREQRIRELRAEYSRLGQLMESDKATAADRVKATAVRREIEQLERLHESPGGSGQREVDPRGQIHQAGGYGRREPGEITTNLTGLSREEDLQGWHEPAKSDPDAEQLPYKGPPGPKARAAEAAARSGESEAAPAERKARFLERARTGDPKLIEEISQHDDPKGLQRAVIALARSGDKGEGTQRVVDALNKRIGELVSRDETVRYGMLLGQKKYSLEGTPEWFYHGTRADEKSLVQPDGSLLLKPSKNWGGKTHGISFTDDRDSAHDYAARIKGGGPTGFQYTGAKILKIHRDALPGIEPETMREWADYSGKEVSVPKGKYTIEPVERTKFFLRDSPLNADFKDYVNDNYRGLERDAVWNDPENTQREFLSEVAADPEGWGAEKAEEAKAILRDQFGEGRKLSAGPTNPGVTHTSNARADVENWIRKTFGGQVVTAWANLAHAGEAERRAIPNPKTNLPYTDFIRLSAHALNPMSTAFHEAMHTFVRHLTDQKMGHITDVLFRAADAAPVLNQLRKIMKDRGFGDKALAQLNDREERAAYMYQFWADGSLKVGDQTKGVLGKIADFIRSVLGIWSNDERAVHIMKYLHEGEYGKDIGSRNLDEVFQRKLMDVHRNAVLEQAKRMTEPFRNMGEALAVAGGQRLRDTGIPALVELSNIMKAHGTAESKDAGWVPAAGAQHRRMVTEMFRDLKGYSQEQIRAAVESLQTKTNAPIDNFVDPQARVNARLAKKAIRAHLDKAYEYMQAAGVNLKDMGYGKDYFPRVYDPDYISRHQQAFMAVLDKHQVKDSEKVMKQIMAGEGADFTVETDKPGMQHLKPRTLAHIPDAELAPFMERDGLRILNGYMKQAARRAEWDRREMGARLPALLDRAAREGATPDDLKAAQNFIRATDGTLGDTINPEARRLMGNMIVYQNLRLLPLGIFSSAVDPLGIVVRGGKVSDAFSAFKRGVTEIAKNFKSDTDVGKDAATQFAEDVGTIDNTMLTRVLGANYSQGMVGDTGRRINDQLFRWNFMEQFNNSMRVAATEAAMGFLKKHADGKASAHSERYLAELGLKPGDVKIDSATGRVKVFEHEGLTADESTAMKAALNRWVDGAVLRPDAVDVPVWMNDPHFALLAHLKRFTYAFHETILKRVAHEYQNGNYAPAMALASYVPTMIAADLVKGLIQGGGAQPSFKQDWDFWDYVESGIERGGLYGTSQFAVDAFGNIRHGGSGIGALTGPTIDQLTHAIKVLGGREQFGDFAVHSMPANALYGGLVGHAAPDAKFPD